MPGQQNIILFVLLSLIVFSKSCHGGTVPIDEIKNNELSVRFVGLTGDCYPNEYLDKTSVLPLCRPCPPVANCDGKDVWCLGDNYFFNGRCIDVSSEV